MSLEDDIKALEEEIRNTPYNKATSHHIGRLKARIARLREQLQKRSGQRHSGRGFGVRRSGHATVALVGFPSVGKSTLLNRLTTAESRVAGYEFTTLDVVPGILEYQGAKIQVLDLPGLVRGASSGRGRGREVISVVRSADLILVVLDVFQLDQYDALAKELYDAGIRLDARPPDVVIKKRSRDGIRITMTRKIELEEDAIKAVLSEYRIHNADVLIRDNINLDSLIDVIQGNCCYIPSLVVINKIDLADPGTLEECRRRFPGAVLVSADRSSNLEELKEKLYSKLNLVRLYLKPQGGSVDFEEPLILRSGSTIADVCDHLHRDFQRRFRYARVWGRSAKHPGQRVGLDHKLDDQDIVTIVLEK